MGRAQKLIYSGTVKDDDILIGSHGHTLFKADGTVELSGIIYSPKYDVTFDLKGAGVVAMRGICNRVIIRRMAGDCKLDLSQLVCKELICHMAKNESTIVCGRVRSVSAFLYDASVLQLTEKPLILNYKISGNARAECCTEVTH
jgi:hypothetical protein